MMRAAHGLTHLLARMKQRGAAHSAIEASVAMLWNV
jgi:hypothetical protein